MKKKTITVSELMSPIVYVCQAKDSLEQAASLLWEHDCGCLPVVDDCGAIEGIITDRDICMAAYTSGRALSTLRVLDSMSIGVESCRPDEPLSVAADRMAAHQVRRLPVLDDAYRVQGILSVNDMACACLGEKRLSASVTTETLKVLTAACCHRTAQGSETRLPDKELAPQQAAMELAPEKTRKTAATGGTSHEC